MIKFYTIITNGFCDLNPNIELYDTFEYYCFSDGSVKIPQGMIHIDLNKFEESHNLDPIQLSRLIKIKPHLFFDDGDTLVFFDPHKVLNLASVFLLLEDFKNNDTDFLIRLHPTRRTYCDEMIWLYYNGLITENEIFLKTESLLNLNYDFYKHHCFINDFLIRKINDHVKIISEKWWDEYTNFQCVSRRDQLPLGITVQNVSNLKMKFIKGEYTPFIKELQGIKHKNTHMDNRPNTKKVAEMQSYLTNKTKLPLFSELTIRP